MVIQMSVARLCEDPVRVRDAGVKLGLPVVRFKW